MAVISLPLNFNNSFWPHDYHTGLIHSYRLEGDKPLPHLPPTCYSYQQTRRSSAHCFPHCRGFHTFSDPGRARVRSSVPPESSAALLSATPGETVDIALLSYIIKGNHVVHLFDHWSSAREIRNALEPYPEFLPSTTPSQESLAQAL